MRKPVAHFLSRDPDWLSDQAIASLLMAHLQPRFRALLEGIVR